MADPRDDRPDGDVAEQHESGDGLPEETPVATVHPSAEASEADLAEQATPVETTQAVLPGGPHDDVDEADWLDQNVVELDPDEDDRR